MTTTPSSSQRYDALVLGAGWSGLITALRLAEAKQKVLVLEARPRIGGRAFTHTFNDSTIGLSQRTVDLAKGDVNGAQSTGDGSFTWWERPGTESIDFGSSWIHGYNEGNPAKELCEKLQVPVSIPPPPKAAGHIIGPSGQTLSAELASRLTNNLDRAMNAAKESARNEVVLLSPETSLASCLFADSSPLFEGLTSQEERGLAVLYARTLHIPLGTTVEHAALRWTGFEQNYTGTDAAPEGGFSRVIQALANEVRQAGGVIHTGKEATSVERVQSGVHVTTKGREVFDAGLLVSTLPLAVLKQASASLFKPALSPRKLDVIRRVNVGNLNKVLLVYEGSAWWQGGSDVPSFTILPSKEPSSPEEPASVEALLASTTLMVSASASPSSSKLLVLIGGPAAKQIESFQRPEVVSALHDYLTERIAGGSAPKSPSHNFMSRWSGHPLTGGATTTPVVIGQGRTPLDFGKYQAICMA